MAVLSVALLCGAGPGKMETFDSHGTKVPVEVFEPPGAGPHPSVVVAYGTDGMTNGVGDIVTNSADAIRHLAGELAREGFVVLIPDYFRKTGTRPGPVALEEANVARKRDAWAEAVEDAMIYADKRPGADKGRVGLLGFSLGGHVVLRAGKEAKDVKAKAVVEFAGPTTIYPLGGGLRDLPVLQVHHGQMDKIVVPGETLALDQALEADGKVENKDYFILWYPNEWHVPFKDKKAVDDAEREVIAFLKKHV